MRNIILTDGRINAEIVGQCAPKIAAMAGIDVPPTTKVLIGEVDRRSARRSPSRTEKLSPVLALYRAKDFEDAVGKAGKLVALGGIGHTSVLYTDQDQQKDRVELLRRADEDRPHPHQHAVLPRRHRRPLQLQPRALPHPGLRQLGRQLHLRERGPQAPAQQQDRRQARGEHAVAQAAAARSTSAAAACPWR